jgi:tight adherence protein C
MHMSDFVTTVMGPEFLVTLLAAICAFASILTFGLPMLERDRADQRMRVMAVEREKLRAERLQEMAAEERQRGSTRLRQAPKGFVRQVVDALGLQEKFDTEELRHRLKAAGFRSEKHLMTFMAFRVILPPVMLIVGLVYMFVIGNFELPVAIKIVTALAVGVLGFYLPSLFIENTAQKRRQSVEQSFPDALDMLLICVQSGMSVEAAFGKVAREVTVQSMELAEELSLTTAELSYLPDRRTAYENLAKRTGLEGVKAVCTALVQAERYGTPVGQALRVMAKENRDIRMSKAEQKAAALPPKLTVPMIIFFLPVLFIAIIGPACINVFQMP